MFVLAVLHQGRLRRHHLMRSHHLGGHRRLRMQFGNFQTMTSHRPPRHFLRSSFLLFRLLLRRRRLRKRLRGVKQAQDPFLFLLHRLRQNHQNDHLLYFLLLQIRILQHQNR